MIWRWLIHYFKVVWVSILKFSPLLFILCTDSKVFIVTQKHPSIFLRFPTCSIHSSGALKGFAHPMINSYVNSSVLLPELLMGYTGPIKVGPWFVKLQPAPSWFSQKNDSAHGPHILLKFIANKICLIISIIDVCYCLQVLHLVNQITIYFVQQEIYGNKDKSEQKYMSESTIVNL